MTSDARGRRETFALPVLPSSSFLLPPSSFLLPPSALNSPPLCYAPDRPPRKPEQRLPPGTVDSHCHVFEDEAKYPLAAERSYTPHACPLDEYLDLCKVLGIERTVQVSASVYGFDNSLTLDVIEKLGQKRARGIAGLRPDVTTAELKRLHHGGMRGMRLSTMMKGYGGTEAIDTYAAKLKPFGWHLQLHVHHGHELAQLEGQLTQCPVGIVFDHFGRTRGGEGVAAPGFQALMRMLKARDDFWVKLSSWYRLSDSGAPDFADMRPLAQALVTAHPDRCVWGSNWPHPGSSVVPPNDGDLVDQFCDWVPDERARRMILLENPERLYGFD